MRYIVLCTKVKQKYFNQQQNNLGKLNGFIEEMISGQKVVKVFCYEKRSLARFRSVNEELKESSQKANIYGNILMPIIIQIGNVSYALNICAVKKPATCDNYLQMVLSLKG